MSICEPLASGTLSPDGRWLIAGGGSSRRSRRREPPVSKKRTSESRGDGASATKTRADRTPLFTMRLRYLICDRSVGPRLCLGASIISQSLRGLRSVAASPPAMGYRPHSWAQIQARLRSHAKSGFCRARQMLIFASTENLNKAFSFRPTGFLY